MDRRRPAVRLPDVLTSPARGEGGFIILGCLILVIVVLTVGVLLGKIFRKQDVWIVSTEGRDVRHAVADAPVVYGETLIRVVPKGDSVWAYPLEDGVIAVYASPEATQVDGFAPDSLFR